jgi:hypothetical protein
MAPHHETFAKQQQVSTIGTNRVKQLLVHALRHDAQLKSPLHHRSHLHRIRIRPLRPCLTYHELVELIFSSIGPYSTSAMRPPVPPPSRSTRGDLLKPVSALLVSLFFCTEETSSQLSQVAASSHQASPAESKKATTAPLADYKLKPSICPAATTTRSLCSRRRLQWQQI